ncbi:phosphoribosylglycinamide formyltransferase [Legionella waltersii]|uniref:Phosphoribosylglycinamide formyltransferase n=1 Tax=Legionella waltersii TaxID=66969 RepID=A0A0W1A2B6_9GAMM|nr:phosphoribosylglycinamide formyltransferase [Legionella waltersii]KTD75155.1 phosphoribosylglycinamide formyltransferase [Legionella waltersii]SNV04778.1 phosphoribosylglycinamide formyltransferase 1 [Legionella waltersii]
MIKLGILGSTRGTNMLAIINAINLGYLEAQISIVLSNKSDAIILDRARIHGLDCQFVSPTGLSRTDYDLKISGILKQHQVDVVVLIGYMRILSPEFISEWPNKVINVHPSLLPAFAGKMDLEVHRAVLQSGVHETGCTIHYVTEKVDAGPILLQKKCSVSEEDTPESLKEKVQKLESEALIDAIQVLSRK